MGGKKQTPKHYYSCAFVGFNPTLFLSELSEFTEVRGINFKYNSGFIVAVKSLKV